MPKRGLESVNIAARGMRVLYSTVRPVKRQDNERPTFGNDYEQN